MGRLAEMRRDNGFLRGDEWVLFQIKEGPCRANCSYCYERPVALKLLGATPDLTRLDNKQLAHFIADNNEKLGLEMGLVEITSYFSILRQAGISRAGLIGSEPTSHSQFREILEAAFTQGIDLLVYTAGMALEKLSHPAIKEIVLHLDYSRLGNNRLRQLIRDKTLPPDIYMEKINRLVNDGKLLDLRINFTNAEMPEQDLIFNFFEKLTPQNRPNVLFKYSFSTRVDGEPDSEYVTPDSLRELAPRLKTFIDEFKTRFPTCEMYAERPLFPCAFSGSDWETYTEKGGFVARCFMEYTIYSKKGLALCPPGRGLAQATPITSATELLHRIGELRKEVDDVFKIPSFPECEPCPHRIALTCQGGCVGYKMGLKNAP
ncbi:MAG: hypothetical protein HYV03_04095 [Deltaproteobacteria bacterium]|nr:hypothetical protein [Deltaproteobacteria bacterium]